MARKRTIADESGTLKAALDVGNGETAGVSSVSKGVIGFEPLIAPMTRKRGISTQDDRPTYSLKVDGQTLVFGVDDVFTHGQRDAMRRQSGLARYTSPDYFALVDVMLMHLFNRYRGTGERIAPMIALNLPVVEFNKPATVEEVRDTLLSNGGKRDISDYEGCSLLVQIEAKRLMILPESAGALMHYAIDGDTLEARTASPVAGSTIVCDIGYETTDLSLFEGMRYQRDRAYTVERAGMGNVTRAVSDYLISYGYARQGDESRIDRALRPIAGKRPGDDAWITLVTGEYNITEVYDQAISDVSSKIADRLHTLYPEGAARAVLAGGGTYHFKGALTHRLAPLSVAVSPTPEHANALGAYTTLRRVEARG